MPRRRARRGLVRSGVLVCLGLAACRADTAGRHDTEAADGATAEVTLYFTDTDQLRTADCSAVLPTTRTVTDSMTTPDAVLRLLLAGVTPNEKAGGLSSQYEPAPAIGSNRPLVDFFRGVEVIDGVAYVDFTQGALAYLNNAACLQGAVKQPMVRTLTQFPAIGRVVFRIDGRVFEDWDA